MDFDSFKLIATAWILMASPFILFIFIKYAVASGIVAAHRRMGYWSPPAVVTPVLPVAPVEKPSKPVKPASVYVDPIPAEWGGKAR